MRVCLLPIGALLLTGCGTSEETLTVAAASNLSQAFEEIARAFTRRSGLKVVLTYGATAQLANQIDNGAPFDVLAAADTRHVDELVNKGRITAGTRAVYARGQLVLWAPMGGLQIVELASLLDARVRHVAIASPAVAPYGEAAVETLRAAGLWQKLEPKIVYATSITMAKQFAASGNADAAFTALSLVLDDPGVTLRVDPRLHGPIDQALGIVAASSQQKAARRFVDFVLGPEGRAILAQYGYELPEHGQTGSPGLP